MNDLLEGKQTEIKIGKHGVVGLIDCMPRVVQPGETFDHAVLQAARVSYGNDKAVETEAANRGLIRYLMRHRHSTPFEMVDIKFYMSLPIFVCRQMVRHRTASINEYSMRYKQPKERFFVPDSENVRKQSTNNKQGSEGTIELKDAEDFIAYTESVAKDSLEQYNKFEALGVGREIARVNLPLSAFTEWYWEIDLANLLHFLSLRRDGHAQKEIRDYADAMYELVKPLAPYTIEAFEDFRFNSMQLTALEIEAIRAGSEKLGPRGTKREQAEFDAKRARLGIGTLTIENGV